LFQSSFAVKTGDVIAQFSSYTVRSRILLIITMVTWTQTPPVTEWRKTLGETPDQTNTSVRLTEELRNYPQTLEIMTHKSYICRTQRYCC